MIVLLSLIAVLTALSTSAFAVAFTALGTADIFASGYTSVAAAVAAGGAAAANLDGTLPTFVPFAAGGGTLTFSGVSGTVSCGMFCAAQLAGGNTADGFAYTGMQSGATNILSANTGISGVSFNGREMFLVAVFLDNNTPSGPGPAIFAPYDANFADNATLYSPGIGQIFDVGNGLTGGPGATPGVAQTYNIPVTATRLFFGFADANGFVGAPGMYFDDGLVGTGISGNVNLALAPSPEPGTMVLMGLGFLGLALLRKKAA